jgi:hypothetical protein
MSGLLKTKSLDIFDKSKFELLIPRKAIYLPYFDFLLGVNYNG